MVALSESFLWKDRVMEYHCKNAKNESPVAVQLGIFSLTLTCEGQSEEIRYSEIVSVEVVKLSGSCYLLNIKTQSGDSLTITNRYHHADGTIEDKSASYCLFVRVLHMHMRDKSKASFKCVKCHRLLVPQKIMIAAALFAVPFFAAFFGVTWLHLTWTGLLLAGATLVTIAISEKSRTVKNYPPKEIPLEFLPS
jgi:hypothetical protein